LCAVYGITEAENSIQAFKLIRCCVL